MAAGPPAIQECLFWFFFFFRSPSSSVNSALRRRRRRWSANRAVSIRSASVLTSRAISSNSFESFTVFRQYSLFASMYEQCCTSRSDPVPHTGKTCPSSPCRFLATTTPIPLQDANISRDCHTRFRYLRMFVNQCFKTYADISEAGQLRPELL